MKEQVLDARGKACPLPVVETRRLLLATPEAGTRVIVDNHAAVENVGRLARSLGRQVEVREISASEFHLSISAASAARQPGGSSAGAETEAAPAGAVAGAAGGCGNVALISSAQFGDGDAELGATLARMFVFTLKEVEPPPSAVVFVNSGVRLTTEGSPVLGDLGELAERGIEILSCGTCLDFYGLKDKLRVGTVTNMFRIVSLLSAADRVLSVR